MTKLAGLSQRLAAGALALGLAAGLNPGARADVGYAFAEQTISGVSIVPTATGATLTGTSPLATSTQSSATVNGVGVSSSDPVDTPETYLGSPPAAPQNLFTKYATFAGNPSPIPSGTLPTGTTVGGGTGNFTRGDAVISGLGTANASASNVAESYLNGSSGTLTANGGFQASTTFTTSASTALTISYRFANDIYTAISGLATVQANYKFNVTIKHTDANGGQVIDFNIASPNTNLNLSAPPNGGEIIRSGNESFTTSTLTSGTVYTLIFTGTESTAVSFTAVPEPGPIALMGVMGSIGAAACAWKRRKATA